MFLRRWWDKISEIVKFDREKRSVSQCVRNGVGGGGEGGGGL